jgi:hypothetical protein
VGVVKKVMVVVVVVVVVKTDQKILQLRIAKGHFLVLSGFIVAAFILNSEFTLFNDSHRSELN